MNIKGNYLISGKDFKSPFFPSVVMKVKEKKDTTKIPMLLRARLFGPVFLEQIKIGARSYIFIPGPEDGDNKGLWIILGAFWGGKFRCPFCQANFSCDEIQHLFVYHEFSKLQKKSLQKNVEIFLKKNVDPNSIRKEAEATGLSLPSYYILGIREIFKKKGKLSTFDDLILPKFTLGVDNLHNLKGCIIGWLKKLLDNERLDEEMFLNRVKQYLLKSSLSKCNGTHSRKILLFFEEIVIPCLTCNQKEGEEGKIKEKLTDAFENLRKISWVANTAPVAQTLPGIKLFLEVICFLFSLSADALPKELELMDLFTHNIIAHFPDFFHLYSFSRGSTEEGESLQSYIKQILRNCTNKKPQQALNEVLWRSSISFHSRLLSIDLKYDKEEALEAISVDISPKFNKQFNKFAEIINKQENIFISKPKEDDNSDIAQSKRALFERIKGRNYPEGYVVEKEDGFVYNVADDIKKYLSLIKKK